MRVGLVICCVVLAALDASAQAVSAWKLMYERDSIKVYYKKDVGSNLYELKLNTKVFAPLSGIVHLLQDVDSYTQWVYKTTKAYTIKTVNDTEKYYYVLSDFPWPLNDRDYVAHTMLTQDEKTKAIISSSFSSPDMLSENNGIVRVRITRTKWVFTPASDGWVDVEYTLRSDPGGNLPDWLVNMAIDKGPYETMQGFKKLLQEAKYRNAKLAYIQELH